MYTRDLCPSWKCISTGTNIGRNHGAGELVRLHAEQNVRKEEEMEGKHRILRLIMFALPVVMLILLPLFVYYVFPSGESTGSTTTSSFETETTDVTSRTIPGGSHNVSQSVSATESETTGTTGSTLATPPTPGPIVLPGGGMRQRHVISAPGMDAQRDADFIYIEDKATVDSLDLHLRSAGNKQWLKSESNATANASRSKEPGTTEPTLPVGNRFQPSTTKDVRFTSSLPDQNDSNPDAIMDDPAAGRAAKRREGTAAILPPTKPKASSDTTAVMGSLFPPLTRTARYTIRHQSYKDPADDSQPYPKLSWTTEGLRPA